MTKKTFVEIIIVAVCASFLLFCLYMGKDAPSAGDVNYIKIKCNRQAINVCGAENISGWSTHGMQCDFSCKDNTLSKWY